MITAEAEDRLRAYLAQLATTPVSVSSITDPGDAWRVHVLDSLVALELDEVGRAEAIADIGTGGGFPGVALAAALPESGVDLIESVGRKCEFMRTALAASQIGNARVVHARAEEWGAGSGAGAYDVVCARALGPLATVSELASPLLRDGGLLVAWKGRPGAEELEAFDAAAPLAAMRPEGAREVSPFPESRSRSLYLVRKAGPTPENLPRRPGMAAKRPLGR